MELPQATTLAPDFPKVEDCPCYTLARSSPPPIPEAHILFYLAQLLFLLTFLAAAMWAAGRCALHMLGFSLDDLHTQNPSVALAVQVMVGFAVLGDLMVGMVLVGRFTPSALLALLGALAILTLWMGKRRTLKRAGMLEPAPQKEHIQKSWPGRAKPVNHALRKVELALGLIVAGALVLLALYPYQGFDFRVYQMPMAMGYAETGAWQWFGDLRFPTFPPLMNLWFALAILLGGDSAPVLSQLLALLPLFLLIVICVVWAQEKGARTPIWTAALLLGSPLVIWAGTFGFIDLAMTLFTTLALYCLDRFHQTTLQHRSALPSTDGTLLEVDGWRRANLPYRWLVLSGVLVGSAMNVKYLAAFFAPFIAAWLVGSWRVGVPRLPNGPANPNQPIALAPLFKALCAFGLPAIAVASPWYLRTWIAAGNPVFPFAKTLFGDNPWGWNITPSKTGLFAALRSLAHPLRWDSLNPWLLPILLVALFFVLRTIARLATRSQSSRNPRSTSLLEATTVSYSLFSLASSTDHRYILPAVALMAILGSVYWEGLLQKGHTFLRARRQRRATQLCLVALHPALFSVAFAALGMGFLGHTLNERGSLPPTPNQYETYLRNHIRGLAALRWAQEEIAPSVIYTFGLNDLAVFRRSARAIGDVFGPYSTRLLMAGVAKKDPVPAKTLREWGVDLVLEEKCGRTIYNVPRFTASGSRIRNAEVQPTNSRTDKTKHTLKRTSLPPTLEEIHRVDGVCIYQLRP